MTKNIHFIRLCAAGALLASNILMSGSTRAIYEANPGPIFLPLVGGGPDQSGVQLLRVHVASEADVSTLVNGGWDVIEARGTDYLLVMGDASVAARLTAQGFRVEVEQKLAPTGPIGGGLARGDAVETYFSGYRTVAEHDAHMTAVATNYPALTAITTYGTSLQGRALRAICITNKANAADSCSLSPTASKPRFLLMAAIHARELTTAEMAYRWIDYLTQNYGVDADVTMMLNNSEMWVIPVVNPDGRVIVEGGGNSPYLQRKNARATGACSNPPTASNQNGVDLNRNSSTDNWGGSGSSTLVCDQTYRGAGPASEPEEQALESLFVQLFADNKGPLRTDAAPATTRGIFLTLHTYSNLVILPYGDSRAAGYAPNDTGLRNLAFRFSYYNGYQTGTGDEILYVTTGTTDDWIYSKLGVPGYTFEMGPASGSCSGFTPAYSCQDGTFWPLNKPAFIYAAKAVRDPYVSPGGPTASGLSAPTVPQGSATTISANVNDGQFGTFGPPVLSPAAPPNPTGQAIAAAEYYVDVPPWAGGTPVAMSATDGAFNTTSENVTAPITTSALSVGTHTIFVRGKDATGTFGPVSAVFLTITAAGGATPTPTPTPTATATPTATPTPGGNTTTTFANAASIGIPDSGTASPYPAPIAVSGMGGTVKKVVVSLNGLTHTYPDDLDILLVGPGGQKLLLLSDAGGGTAANNLTLTFDDAATGTIGTNGPMTTGTFKPINYGTGDTFAAPAPAGTYATALSTFVGSAPNGTWSLYVVDDAAGDSGVFSGGWSLTITAGP